MKGTPATLHYYYIINVELQLHKETDLFWRSVIIQKNK